MQPVRIQRLILLFCFWKWGSLVRSSTSSHAAVSCASRNPPGKLMIWLMRSKFSSFEISNGLCMSQVVYQPQAPRSFDCSLSLASYMSAKHSLCSNIAVKISAGRFFKSWFLMSPLKLVHNTTSLPFQAVASLSFLAMRWQACPRTLTSLSFMVSLPPPKEGFAVNTVNNSMLQLPSACTLNKRHICEVDCIMQVLWDQWHI